MDALFSDYEDIQKSGLFDAEYYLTTNPDVAERNIDPLVHYLEEGARQARKPFADFDIEFYLEQCRLRGEEPVNPLLHYIRVGEARGFKTRPDKPGGRAPGGRSPRARTQLGKPPILVAIEALEVVDKPLGITKVTVTGWALAAAPIAEITVSADGKPVGSAALGRPRPDVARLYPDRPGAAQSGFLLDFQIPNVRRRTSEPLLTVRTADGEVGYRSISLVEPPSTSATAADADLHLHIDSPHLIGNLVETPIRGNLEISGWALARSGVEAIEVTLDGAPLALAEYGLRRLDIRAAYPDLPDALASGYQALVPHRLLPKGSHGVAVTLRARDGRTTSTAFAIEVEELSETPGPWALRRKLGQAEIDLGQRILATAGLQPMFVALLTLADDAVSIESAAATIASLERQVYRNWHLLIVPHSDGNSAEIRHRLLPGAKALGERAELLRNPTPRALAAIGAGAGAVAGGVFATILSPGDELGVDAFLELAIAAAQHPGADFFYSDERCRNSASGNIEAFFKPDWSPDLMMSTNYVGRLWCARGDLLGTVVQPTEPLLALGEYDLALRCTEQAKAIRHVAAVLCERASDHRDAAREAGLALERMLVRCGINGAIEPGAIPGTFRLKRSLTRPGLVSILIPTCAARGMIETCINTLRRVTAYRNYEIVCVENIAPRDRKWRAWLRRSADHVIATQEPFNWARFSNLAATQAKGEYLLFLNDDIEFADPGWLEAMLEHAQRPEVGVVGPSLLYPDRRVQHAGMFLAVVGQARHAFRYLAEDDPGYFGLARTQRNVIAVTGACLMTRREVYDALGGFDESQSIVNNDLDFSLRAWQRGLVNIYTPHATLVHHEAVSRAALDDEFDEAVFDSKWRDVFVAGDPYFSPHLSKYHDDFAIDHEPTRLLVTGRPVMAREEIRNILAVKLDHIGDCVIAFPAIRRLKEHFPEARITVLTSRASQPIWALEPSVKRTIEFDFFHARSGLGELDRTESDWQELYRRLSAERFDLAVDLRKHTETRPLLQYTGARYLAGFDFRNQFGWLDVALEWDGDQIYARKRQHNADDLVNLVDAIAAACDRGRLTIAARPTASPALAKLRRGANSAGPLVCVHPAVGNDARQWPVEYFAAVIDRLVEEDGAQIVLIGAAGDEEIAAGILARIRDKKSISSLVGKVPLGELPALLAGVSLFLGNNSGPKHIAAGLGVPTVGVHSGTEDVREWGPVGPAAIAVAREVICAPCYLASAADCRRGLACLRQLEPARVYEACKRLLPLSAERPTVAKPSRAARAR